MDKRCYICESSRHLCGQCPKKYSIPEEERATIGRPYSRRYSDYRDKRDDPVSGKNDSFFPSRTKQDGTSTNEEATGNYRNDKQLHPDRNRGSRRVKRYCTICRRYGHGTRDCWYNKTHYDDGRNFGSSSRRHYDSNDRVDSRETHPCRQEGRYKQRPSFRPWTPPVDPKTDAGSDRTANCGKRISKRDVRKSNDRHERASSITVSSEGSCRKSRDRQLSTFTNSSTSDDNENESHSSRRRFEKTVVKRRPIVNSTKDADSPRSRTHHRHTRHTRHTLDNNNSNDELSPYDSDDFHSENSVNTFSDESVIVAATHRRPRRGQSLLSSPDSSKSDIKAAHSNEDDSSLLFCKPGDSISQSDLSNHQSPSGVLNVKIANGITREQTAKSRTSEVKNSCSDDSLEYLENKTDYLNSRRPARNAACKPARKVVAVLPSVRESNDSESNHDVDNCNDDDFGIGDLNLEGAKNNGSSFLTSGKSKSRLYDLDYKRIHYEDGRSEQETLGLYPPGKLSSNRLDRLGKGRSQRDRGMCSQITKNDVKEFSNNNDRRAYHILSGPSRRIASNQFGKRNLRPSATKRLQISSSLSGGSGGLLEVYSPNEVTCYNCGRNGHKSFDCPESGINRQRLR